MKSIFAVSVVATLALWDPPVQSADQKSGPDISIVVQDFEGPFVTRSFAEHLGQLVVSEKYQGALVTADQPPEVSDKGAVWSVTIKVERWLLPPLQGAGTPLAPRQLTISIRKMDGAIISIR